MTETADKAPTTIKPETKLEQPEVSPSEPNAKPEEKSKLSHGGRNLLLLGLGATLVAFLTVFVSLKIYHDSGDIYLDRSRPGFLPEAEETEKQPEEPSTYIFSDSGELSSEVLDEYLENLKKEINRLNDFTAEPFGATPLSDETLGF